LPLQYGQPTTRRASPNQCHQAEKIVTADEWIICTDPQEMLEFLLGKASERKLRLFAVACARRILPLLTDPRSRHALEAAELFVDGQTTKRQLKAARQAAVTACREFQGTDENRYPKEVACWSADGSAQKAAERASADLLWALASEKIEDFGPAWNAGLLTILGDLRDIFGNPCRPVALDPAWRTWHDGTIVQLAQAIYEERAFDRLPILADALEEAGCTDAELLGHLRGIGPHSRGCWAVDAILGRA